MFEKDEKLKYEFKEYKKGEKVGNRNKKD